MSQSWQTTLGGYQLCAGAYFSLAALPKREGAMAESKLRAKKASTGDAIEGSGVKEPKEEHESRQGACPIAFLETDYQNHTPFCSGSGIIVGTETCGQIADETYTDSE